MNNDLISRSELKTALANNSLIRDFNLQYDGILGEIIDNAPAVEAVSLEHHNKIKGIMENEVKSLVDILDKGRPQGEWATEFDRMKCPFCGFSIDDEVHWLYSEEYNFNFCPNCGAKMEKGGET